MVDTWALKGFLYHYLGVQVSTIMILGPFGLGKRARRQNSQDQVGVASVLGRRLRPGGKSLKYEADIEI